jgi:hypothetical protein
MPSIKRPKMYNETRGLVNKAVMFQQEKVLMGASEYIALLAVVISFVSLYRTRKQTEIENKFNELSSRIAEIQLRRLEEEEQKKKSADVHAYFYKDYNNNYRVAIGNGGEVEAMDVNIEIDLHGSHRSPIIESEMKSKLPVKILHPGQEVYLVASLSLNMPTSYNCVLTWNNPDGKSVSKDIVLSLVG